MSRGPGRWQRHILDAVEKHGAVWLHDLLPSEARRAQYTALHRAATRLADAGRVEIKWRSWSWQCERYYYTRHVVTLPGTKVPRAKQIPRIRRISVDKPVMRL